MKIPKRNTPLPAVFASIINRGSLMIGRPRFFLVGDKTTAGTTKYTLVFLYIFYAMLRGI
ncbi:MAG: hypothetical protein JW966_04995 [Anaerolineae bacterium]|nr:hypothetical protein [Anaerolineae bacterium]